MPENDSIHAKHEHSQYYIELPPALDCVKVVDLWRWKNHSLYKTVSPEVGARCDVCWIEALCYVESHVIALRYERSYSDLIQLYRTCP